MITSLPIIRAKNIVGCYDIYLLKNYIAVRWKIQSSDITFYYDRNKENEDLCRYIVGPLRSGRKIDYIPEEYLNPSGGYFDEVKEAPHQTKN